MIRTALVALDGSPLGQAAVDVAIEWARRFGTRLVGLGVLDEPSITRPEPVSLGATGFKRERDQVSLATAHRRVLTFLGEFRARCEDEGVTCSVLEDVGRPAEQIVREAQSCDVVIIGRETNFHLDTQDRDRETLGRVIRDCPRPVVVVPGARVAGTGVLVAYGGGREVARTLQVFTCLGLARDEVVDVMTVDPSEDECERRLRHADEYLAAHEVAHRLHRFVTDEAAAPVIVEELRRRRPRLLVMGAYGRHPVRDLFVTSVTRTVLDQTPVPLFVGA